MEEIWKDVEGYEGLYSVSNLGRIKTFKNAGKSFLKPWKQHLYMAVTFRKDGKSQHRLLHRVVLKAFKPNPLNKPYCNHINGIKDDNRADNLEWCTNSENIRHAYATGLNTNKMREAQQACRKQVECIETGEIFESTVAAAKAKGVTDRAIANAARGKSNSSAGFTWRYLTVGARWR